MSVWVLEAEIGVVLALLAFPLALGPMTYLHYRRHGQMAGWSALVTLGAFFYGWGVVAFTLFPLPTSNTEFCTLREDLSYWQLVPFAATADLIDAGTADGIVAVLTSAAFWQVAFNILLMVPLGFLVAYRLRKGIGWAVGAGLSVSVLIELTQGTGVWWLHGCPYRLADVDDLLLNTAGAAVGWMIGRVLRPVLPDPDPPAVPDLDPPRVGRRALATAIDYIALVVVGIVVQVPFILALGPQGEAADPELYGQILLLVGVVLASVCLFVIVPLVRRDRATPGQVSTWLAVVHVGTQQPATGAQIATRWLVRWAPLTLGLWIEPLAVIAVVAFAEIATTTIRSDHRSASAAAAGTDTITRRSLPDRAVQMTDAA